MQRILSVYLNFKVLKCFCDSSSKFSYQSLYQQLLLKSPKQAVMIGSICQSGKIKSLPSFADADGHKFINLVCMTASIQFSPKIMHAQELLFASARRSSSCGWLRVAWAWVLETARTSLRLHDKSARTSLRFFAVTLWKERDRVRVSERHNRVSAKNLIA